jgi:hypothetical protein
MSYGWSFCFRKSNSFTLYTKIIACIIHCQNYMKKPTVWKMQKCFNITDVVNIYFLDLNVYEIFMYAVYANETIIIIIIIYFLCIYLFIYFLSSTTFRVGLRTWFSDRSWLTVHVKFYASLLSTNCNMNRHWSKSLGFPLWWNIEENIKIKCINIKLSPPV